MILVTVGTHEQPFNRLVQYMDKWAKENDEEVLIQLGYTTYLPSNCKYEKLFPYSKMIENVNKARIVITHGGPSSFIMPLQVGKIPIVVPRKKEYEEHVNDHQVDFCKQVGERQGNIIVIDDIEELGKTIHDYDAIISTMKSSINSNNARFCKDFERIIEGLKIR